MKLQKIAIESLVRNIEYIKQKQDDKSKNDADSGAVVMMDVQTGEILAMASYPYYDPNDFVLAASDSAAAKRIAAYLADNKNKPMLNRAIMENYAPGSTFKPLTATAALESGTITPNTIVHDPGAIDIGGWKFKCLEYPVRGHGDLSLTRGMATSCNIFFQLIGTRAGIDNINHWGYLFGLGEYTGIDLPGEVRGIRASKEMKKRLRMNPEDQVWFPADTAQTSIGQFDNSFTVLQLCRYTAALANGGYLVTPHVVKDIIRPDGSLVRAESLDTTKIPVQDATLRAIREAMIATVTDPQGTARKAFKDFPISVACKTGTAETGLEDRASSNALFICYAPADNPQVAIAQIVEKGVWGSNTAGIARDLLSAYFGLD
jgi:penicillin-binding protein 2